MQLEEQQSQALAQAGPGPEAQPIAGARLYATNTRSERLVRASFIWPALLVVLLLSIFPLLISLYLSLSHLSFVTGGFDIRFVGFENYRTLLFGSEKTRLLGLTRPPSLIGWLVFAVGVGVLAWPMIGVIRRREGSIIGLILRGLWTVFAAGILLLIVQTFSPGGRPGSFVV